MSKERHRHYLAATPAVLFAAIVFVLPKAFAGDTSTSAAAASLALDVEHTATRVLSLDGDAAYGEYLGGECATCHRQSGDGGSIPPIRGLPADYAVRALVEYKLGARNNNVMKLMAGRLSDEEIAALAAYFSGLESE